MAFRIRVSQTALDEIDILMQETGVTSRAQLFSNSLALYMAGWIFIDDGVTLLVKKSQKEIDMLETALGMYLFPPFAAKSRETADLPFSRFKWYYKGEDVKTMRLALDSDTGRFW